LNLNSKPSSETQLAQVFRAESGRLIAALMSQCRDIQLAEDALQDALTQAVSQWPSKGFPSNPRAWLYAVSRRRLIDRLRQTKRHDEQQIAEHIHECLTPEQAPLEAQQEIPDERLKLIFICCHPALSEQAQLALTLKTLCGLTVKEIARAFLISEVTLNQRLVRAKRKIKVKGISYEVPTHDNVEHRLDSVLSVIYLIYNESYSAYEGQTLTRNDLAQEAIRLARVLYRFLPKPSVAGLLALLLFHQSRSPARQSQTESFIPLAMQDRDQWNQALIAEGRKLLLTAITKGQAEKYQIQAAISALHSEAKSWQETDWQQIQLLYLSLLQQEPNPIVELNMLVALAQCGQTEQALRRIYTLEQDLGQYQPYFAARADLETKLSKRDAAIHSYSKAIKMTKNTPERDFLIKQLGKVDKLPTIP